MELDIPPANHLEENFEDFFEQSLCGFVIANGQGMILRNNAKVCEWVGCPDGHLKGKRFSELLTIGSKVYYETHLWPLLRMQGFFDEVVLEVISDKRPKLMVMVNALERRDEIGKPLFIRYTIVKASDRLQYEQNLQQAKITAEKELLKQVAIVALREQLIAVLGHDLRNPLAAITMAAEMLQLSPPGKNNSGLIAMLQRSTSRMTELVNNIMDFARTRLGEGIILDRQDVLLQPLIEQVVAELQVNHPDREITTSVETTGPVNCDPFRLSQLLSNLLANALTHGAPDKPVYIHAFGDKENFELSVTNSGIPIPVEFHEHLFMPFTREENRPSQHGLGLGLYIASEIAKAHHALLSFTSTSEETHFTFQLHS